MRFFSISENKYIIWSFLFLLCFLMGMIFSYTPYGTGDKTEYCITTESLIYDRDLIYTPGVDLERHLAYKPHTIDYAPGQIYLIENTRDGKVRLGGHSFYYPLANVPLYLLFSIFGHRSAYHSFYFLNAIMFFFCILMGFKYFKARNSEYTSFFASASFFTFSASMTYVLWIHSEIFVLFLVTAYLFYINKLRYYFASIIIGIAAAVKLPLLAFLLPLWYDFYIGRQYKEFLISLVIVFICMFPQYYYNVMYLGSFSPIVSAGFAAMRFITPSTVVGSVFDPFYGLIWFYPLTIFAVFNMEKNPRNYLMLLSGLLILIGMNGTAHIFSHQVGLRYLTFIYPLFLFLVGEIQYNRRNGVLYALSLMITAGLVINPINNSLGPAPQSIRHYTYLPYKIARSVFHIRDNPEVAWHSSKGLSNTIKVIGGYVEASGWTSGGAWLRLLLGDVSEGNIRLKVRGWPRDYNQKLTLRINHGNQVVHELKPQDITEISIPVSKDDIEPYSKRWVHHLVYLDLRPESWMPLEVSGDSGDKRSLGVQLIKIWNNDRVIYENDESAK